MRSAIGSGIALIALLLTCGWTGTATRANENVQHEADVRVGEDANGKEVDLKAGQSFLLRLSENPTTGYVWRFVKIGEVEENGAPICSILGDAFIPAREGSNPRVGAPGVHQWRFRADTAGKARVELQLRRGWEPGSAKRSFALHLRVT